MKVLLSCVNTLVSFIGFDLELGQAFWYCPSDRVRACGACYDQATPGLLVATDNTLIRYQADGAMTRVDLPGPHDALAHSVHVLEGLGIGVADTGNSRLLLYGQDLRAGIALNALEGWNDLPLDALHLNDFTLTPEGIVASCFHYQSFRTLDIPGYDWKQRGHGLILSLERRGGRSVGRILACGLQCPHSLVWHGDALYCCASASGELVRFAFTAGGLLAEQERTLVAERHFLRGALPLPDGGWLLGGSADRLQENHDMSLFRLRPDGSRETMRVAATGEIYDILPWDDDIMGPVAALMSGLPPDFAHPESDYPPPMTLE